MHTIKKTFIIYSLLFIQIGYGQEMNLAIVPAPKEIDLANEKLCVEEDLSVYLNDPELTRLYKVFREEFFTISGKQISKSHSKGKATFSFIIDSTMKKEEYEIQINKKIEVLGGSYEALTMASTTLLQGMTINANSMCWNTGSIRDYPDFNFRGVLLDVARQKHDIATIKRIIVLCKWYKINHLQLHLTDGNAFTVPSETYPQL